VGIGNYCQQWELGRIRRKRHDILHYRSIRQQTN
jgi:hypothetical protein